MSKTKKYHHYVVVAFFPKLIIKKMNRDFERGKLSPQIQRELLSEFCEALLGLKNIDEVMKFLIDLLTRSEALMLAKRIKIAKFLLIGKTYKEIEEELRASHGTITKVAEWLNEGGEGFRMVAKRAQKKQKEVLGDDIDFNEWSLLKRKYPIAFWPQLLLEEIIKSANRRQKERLSSILKKLDQKSKLYKDVTRVLKRY